MNGLLNPFILGSGDPPFVPPGSPTWWHKADAIVGLGNGDPIPTWEDSTANNYDMVAQGGDAFYLTNQFNGKPSVQFTNAEGGYFLNGDLQFAIADRTIIMVFDEAVHINSGGVLMLSPNSGNAYNSDGGVMIATGNGEHGIQILGGSGSAYSLEFTSTNGLHIWSEIVTGGNGSLYCDGIEQANTNFAGFGTNTGGFGYGAQYLGGVWDAAYTPNLRMPEVVGYTTAISGPDHVLWINYLKAKYGIA